MGVENDLPKHRSTGGSHDRRKQWTGLVETKRRREELSTRQWEQFPGDKTAAMKRKNMRQVVLISDGFCTAEGIPIGSVMGGVDR